MSYSGTVYCSYCGQRGHNMRSCPKRKEYIANNPDSWQAKDQASRERRRQARGRRCSYCGDRGHTARTCEKKKNDKQLLIKKLASTRRAILDKMANSGLGIGALLEVRRHSWGDYPSEIAMVTSVRWDSTDNLSDVHFTISLVSNPTDQFLFRRDLNHASQSSVLSRASIDSIEKSAPLKWLAGKTYDEDTYFPKGTGRQWWHFDEQ